MIGEVLQKASSWFRENLPQKSPNFSAEEVSAHDVDEGMETEHMGFTSSIALQYVSQAQVGLTCDLAWNPKHKCLKFTITNNPGRGGTIHQWEDRDRQGGWEKGGWFKDVVRFPTDINLDRFPASLACGSGLGTPTNINLDVVDVDVDVNWSRWAVGCSTEGCGWSRSPTRQGQPRLREWDRS